MWSIGLIDRLNQFSKKAGIWTHASVNAGPRTSRWATSVNAPKHRGHDYAYIDASIYTCQTTPTPGVQCPSTLGRSSPSGRKTTGILPSKWPLIMLSAYSFFLANSTNSSCRFELFATSSRLTLWLILSRAFLGGPCSWSARSRVMTQRESKAERSWSTQQRQAGHIKDWNILELHPKSECAE